MPTKDRKDCVEDMLVGRFRQVVQALVRITGVPTAGGPVMRLADVRKSCALFIAFFAMSGRCHELHGRVSGTSQTLTLQADSFSHPTIFSFSNH